MTRRSAFRRSAGSVGPSSAFALAAFADSAFEFVAALFAFGFGFGGPGSWGGFETRPYKSCTHSSDKA